MSNEIQFPLGIGDCEYMLSVIASDGTRRIVIPGFSNAIVNNGMNALASSGTIPAARACVGDAVRRRCCPSVG
jgi:hypothetical protein